MKIQHKRSNQLDSGEAKAPLVDFMEYGELAVNFNKEDPAIFVKVSDGTNALNDQVIRIAGLGSISGGVPDGPTDERPDTPSLGDLYFDTDLNLLLYWDGSEWKPVGKDNVALISETAPNTTQYPEGTFWWDSSEDSGRLFILYNDPTDSNELFWVEASPGGSGGSKTVVQEAPPAPGNFVEGDMWWSSASDSGQLFILYDDPVDNGGGGKTWVAAAPSNNSTDYVKKTGDNMTGPLTIGPDGGPAVTTLAANGTATFTNTVIADGPDSAAAALLVRSNYTAGTGNQVFLVRGNTDNDIAWINGDGNATFAGNVRLSPSSTITGHTINLFGANGDATFGGVIRQGTYDSGNTNGKGCYIGGGTLIAQQPASAVTSAPIFQGRYGTGENALTTEISAVGNAKFKGQVVSGNDPSSAANVGIKMTPTGSLIATGATSAITMYQPNDEVAKIIIYTTGSAQFAGTITTQGGAGGPYVAIGQTITFNTGADNDANYVTTTEEYEEQEELTPYIPAVPATYDDDGNELTAEVPAVEATYQTVTKTREVRTYNGPTLDVKERLQNLIARLDALEADELAEDATSTLLLTTVNNLNADMAKTKAALTAIRAAASVAGTLEELKADIITATADIQLLKQKYIRYNRNGY